MAEVIPSGTISTPYTFSSGFLGQTIPDNGSSNLYQVNVPISGYLWDINVTTNISHNWNEDLDIFLTSPNGTKIILTTDNGDSFDNGFNAAVWDDDLGTPVSEIAFFDNVGFSSNPFSPLVPESALGVFMGEDIKGDWTLTVRDDEAGIVGTLDSWQLDFITLDKAPSTTRTEFLSNNSASILDNQTRSSTLNVTTEGTFITDIDLTTLIEHTSSGDLDILLRSPVGTEVIISTDNGGAFNDVFNGTRWDDQANAPVTEHPFNFTSNAPVTTLTPEDALSAFKGEDPNGIWTLEVRDNVANAETGLLNGWSLDIETVGQPTPPVPLEPPIPEEPPVPGPGDDDLRGTNSDDILNGFEGDDKLLGLSGNDNLIGGEGDDNLRGNGGQDTLDGGEGNDKLIGGGGSDQLAGGVDDDLLKGGGGSDTLNGGEGRDKLIGGGGKDIFVIGDGDGRDIIQDYRDGKDQIELSGSLGFSDLDILKRGRHVLIRTGGEDIALVRHTSVDELTVADFI